MPYPNICGVIEAAPEAPYPFFIPEYKTENGDIYRPIQFYTSVTTAQDGNAVKIRALGNLAKCGEKLPVRSEYGFEVNFVFEGDVIRAEFVTDLKYATAEMLIGYHGDTIDCKVFGFDGEAEETVDGIYDFKTPAGAITKAITYKASNVNALGYEVKLK